MFMLQKIGNNYLTTNINPCKKNIFQNILIIIYKINNPSLRKGTDYYIITSNFYKLSHFNFNVYTAW